MEISKFSFSVESNKNCDDIVLKASIDDRIVQSIVCDQTPTIIEIDVPEDEKDHEILIEISGKTFNHTKLDSSGNIVDDLLVAIDNIKIDDIDITQLFYKKAVYMHDNNGSADLDSHQFFGDAGCNGTISFQIKTPAYLWLLENM